MVSTRRDLLKVSGLLGGAGLTGFVAANGREEDGSLQKTSGVTTPTTTTPQSDPTIQISGHPERGVILTDPEGMTLYRFTEDTDGESTCTGQCTETWPPVTVEESPTPPPGLPGTLATVERDDGTKQVTYDGKPLYRFSGDEKPGDANGHGVNDAWFTATLVPPEDVPDWQTMALTDVRTDEQFTIADFYGRPVLLEFFAVWCPVCTKQQRKVRELHEEVGDDVVSVSINTDPNEDAETARSYLQDHEFDWPFAVAPPELTKAFVSEFGQQIASPPAAPVVIVCPDGSASLLSRGVKSASELRSAIENCEDGAGG